METKLQNFVKQNKEKIDLLNDEEKINLFLCFGLEIGVNFPLFSKKTQEIVEKSEHMVEFKKRLEDPIECDKLAKEYNKKHGLG